MFVDRVGGCFVVGWSACYIACLLIHFGGKLCLHIPVVGGFLGGGWGVCGFFCVCVALFFFVCSFSSFLLLALL